MPVFPVFLVFLVFLGFGLQVAYVRRMIERIGQDLRFAGRMFLRTPGFTVVAVLITALSIAANVSVFSFVNALFLRELPVKDASRLVRVYGTARNRDDRFFSYSEYAYLRDRTK